jgi:hypothetical protein
MPSDDVAIFPLAPVAITTSPFEFEQSDMTELVPKVVELNPA